jgi:Pretoxin HINT domain
MTPIALLCLGLFVADEDAAAYRAAAEKAGKDAGAHVRLALWCEAHGMTAERMKHLATAVLHDPGNAMARGLLGMVAYNGKWERPDEVTREAKDDPKRRALMQEYLDRRAKTPEVADAHLKLADWCEQNGLKPQATAHYQRVLRLDPRREAAWRHLGFKKVGGRWVNPEQLAAERTRVEEQQRADRRWKPILERARAGLQSKTASRRADAEQVLSRITEPDAVPMVWATFGRGEPVWQKVAVRVLGQIDDGSASRALAMLAVFGGSPEVRRQATQTLRNRDAREFAAMLIGMILEPIEYEVKRVQGPGQGGELLIKGQGSAPNVRRLYSPPLPPAITPQLWDRVVYDANGLPVLLRPEQFWTTSVPAAQLLNSNYIPNNLQPTAAFKSQFTSLLAHSGLGTSAQKVSNAIFQNYEAKFSNPLTNPFVSPLLAMAGTAYSSTPLNSGTTLVLHIAAGEAFPVGQMAVEAQKTAYAAEQQLETDVATIREYNASLSQINDRVLPVLRDVSGLDLGPKPVEWQKWFLSLVGFQLNQMQASPKSTVIEDVPLAYQPQPIPIGQFVGPIGVSRISCFGAGTLVRTLTGPEPIESLKIGDPVLTQSTRTGALGYKPIMAVHHNPPSRTFRVAIGGEAIVSSEFHRFWKAGQGWVMARDLKKGDPIRTLDGPAAVTSIERGEVVPVYNLDVADDGDFFVGRGGALVHDNTLPDLREKPFDAVGPLTAEPGAAPARGRTMLGR